MPTKRKRDQLVQRLHNEEIQTCYKFACGAIACWPENEQQWKQICEQNKEYFSDSKRKVHVHVCLFTHALISSYKICRCCSSPQPVQRSRTGSE